MQIFRQLSPVQEDLLKNLEQVCFAHDGFSPPIHWDLIREVRPIPLNFFYPAPDESEWLAYLSAFLFKEKEIELSGLTHPSYRRQHLFGFLLAHALHHMNPDHWEYLTSRIPYQLKSGQECFRYLGGKITSREYEMECRMQNFPYLLNLNTHFTIHSCTIEDSASLAELHEKIFSSNVEIMSERYKSTLLEPQRYTWIIKVNHENVGKLHIKKKPNYGLIHDFGIIPAYRQQKLALSFLYELLKNFSKEHQINCFKLHVLEKNEAALNLYKKLGFHISEIQEVWKVEKALIQPYILKTFYQN